MASAKAQFTCTPSLPAWLAEQQVSLGFTTYEGDCLFLIGLRQAGALGAAEWPAKGCMGLWASPERLWVASKTELWQLGAVHSERAIRNGYDRVFTPQASFFTGPLDVHDVVIDRDGRLVFVSTQYNCLGTLDAEGCFEPIWRPPFISQHVAEDRCHLNGLAMRDGEPAFVTTVSRSDVVDGWRDRRKDGGCVTDVASGEIVARGLSMPHSPRWHQGKLWVLDSGRGHFGFIDLPTGKFESVAFLPGYLRGLAFVGRYAVIGLSNARHEKTFGGLDLAANLVQRDTEARCGIHVVDIETGSVVVWMRIDGTVRELYDVVTLPQVRNPTMIGVDSPDFDEVAELKAG